MDLVLWELNRANNWEYEHKGAHQGAMARALRSAGHRVVLGQRAAISDPDPPASGVQQFTVNLSETSTAGQLMHEGHRPGSSGSQASSSFDEYFVPIPLKCLGKPDYEPDGRPKLTKFWENLIKPGMEAEFLQIFDTTINPCFVQASAEAYWGGRLSLPKAPKEFADVQMNTEASRKLGYYQILQQPQPQPRVQNVLVGYSEGGTVAAYLAYIDEHFVDPTKRCIFGVVTVQAPLRGATFAMKSNERHVLASLKKALRLIPIHQLIEYGVIPPGMGAKLEALVDQDHLLTIEKINDAIDVGFTLAQGWPNQAKLTEMLKTARKWLSGLSGEDRLAFYDMDSERLDQPGSVMKALQTPLLDTYCAGVVGTSSKIEEIAHDLLLAADPNARPLGLLLKVLVAHVFRSVGEIYQEEVMDMLPLPASDKPSLEELRQQWHDGVPSSSLGIQSKDGIPPQAHDFIIPSVSQLMPQGNGAQKFLGNWVNPDATHLSGADLLDLPPTDLRLVLDVLSRMTP